MRIEDLKKYQIFQTSAVMSAMEDDFETRVYVQSCLDQYFTGDYGLVKKYPEDVEANNRELESGYGRIIARYPSKYNLDEDIYIITYFDKDAHIDDINRCNTTILYCSEY